MSETPNTILDLIDQWPTIGEFASAIGCKYEAARQMRLRNSIAPEHWGRVIDAANAQGIPGISYDWLMAQRSSSPTPTSQDDRVGAA